MFPNFIRTPDTSLATADSGKFLSETNQRVVRLQPLSKPHYPETRNLSVGRSHLPLGRPRREGPGNWKLRGSVLRAVTGTQKAMTLDSLRTLVVCCLAVQTSSLTHSSFLCQKLDASKHSVSKGVVTAHNICLLQRGTGTQPASNSVLFCRP